MRKIIVAFIVLLSLSFAACGGDSSTPTAPTPTPTPTPTPDPTPPATTAPDLEVGSPSVSDNSPATGATFTLSATVRNAGDGAATATTLRYRRSTDGTITTSDILVGTDAVGGLAAGATSGESTSLTAPSTAGTYYYGACVDAVTDESDSTNNCSTSVQVTVPAPTPPPTPTPTPTPLSGSAVEGTISKCEGTQLVAGGSIVEVEIEGTVRALRSVLFVSVEGTANGSFVGRDSLGHIEAGNTKSFSIQGFPSLSGSTLRCEVKVTYRTSGSSVVSSVSFD